MAATRKTKRIFISHKEVDRELALTVKRLMRKWMGFADSRPDSLDRNHQHKSDPLQIFLTCDHESLERGKPWFEKVRTAAQDVFAKLTPHGGFSAFSATPR